MEKTRARKTERVLNEEKVIGAKEKIVYRVRAVDKLAFMFAGFGLYSACLALPWQIIRPILPGDAISAAEAAMQADEERLQLMNEAAKRVKKPNLKEKPLTASLKSAK